MQGLIGFPISPLCCFLIDAKHLFFSVFQQKLFSSSVIEIETSVLLKKSTREIPKAWHINLSLSAVWVPRRGVFLSKSFDKENLLKTVAYDNIKIEKRRRHACRR